MPKYNFHEIKGKTVPADLNDPVRKMLAEDLRCPEALELLNDMERCKNCGSIEIYDLDSPKHVTIKTNYGMVEGWDLVKTHKGEKRMIIQKKHIKNHNLSMKGTAKNG